jgi:hypothetical protein
MRLSFRLTLVWVGLALIALGAGGLAAQAQATPEPITLSCDLAQLQQMQSDLAASLQNFSEEAQDQPGSALDTLFKVGAAYQQLALDCGYIPADIANRPVGTDVERILTTLDKVVGDPLNGQLLYNEALACAGCHLSEARIAPALDGTYTRILDTRLSDAQLSDYTPAQYIIESIVDPGVYVVAPYQDTMIPNFGDRITLQELADLIAFLESQDGPSPE